MTREKATRRQEMIRLVIEKILIWLNFATIGALGVILYHNFQKWVS
jgi:hypothetical protein